MWCGVPLEVYLAGSVLPAGQGMEKTGTLRWVDMGPKEGEIVCCPSSQLPWVPVSGCSVCLCSGPASSDHTLTPSLDNEVGEGDACEVELLVPSDPPLLFPTGVPEQDVSSSSAVVLVGLVSGTAALVMTVLMFFCMK